MSSMAMENKKTINDLPLELLSEILLRFPVKSLLLLRCVSKTWLHLISDPKFSKSHFERAAPTRRCLFIQGTKALSYDVDALFHKGYAPVTVSLRCMKPSKTYVLGSCRGLILLDQYPNLIIWNPSTGAHKRVSYSHLVSLSTAQKFRKALLYGFGHDASKDDYLIVLAWRDKNMEDHFDFFSVRNNSWKSFEVALPNPTPPMRKLERCGLFLNGAFHWLANPRYWLPGPHRDDPILVFGVKERSFSEIPLPKQRTTSVILCGRVMELEGCLAMLFWSIESQYEIWLMKEYKVQSSWTWYGVFGKGFDPLGLSNAGDIIGYDFNKVGFSKYNVSGHKLEHCGGQLFVDGRHIMYIDSLMSLPNDSGHLDCQECSLQLDAIKKRKRTRSAPTWTRDFYCN